MCVVTISEDFLRFWESCCIFERINSANILCYYVWNGTTIWKELPIEISQLIFECMTVECNVEVSIQNLHASCEKFYKWGHGVLFYRSKDDDWGEQRNKDYKQDY